MVLILVSVIVIFSWFLSGRFSVWEFSRLWSFLKVIKEFVKVILLIKVLRKMVVLWIFFVGLLVKRFILVRYLVMVVRIVVKLIKLWNVVISWGRSLTVMRLDMIVLMVLFIFIMVFICVSMFVEGVRVFMVVVILVFIFIIFRYDRYE